MRREVRSRSGGGGKAGQGECRGAEQMESVRRGGAGASGGAAVADSGERGGGAGAASGGRGERGSGACGNQGVSAMCDAMGRASGMQPRDVPSANGRASGGMRIRVVLGMPVRLQSRAAGGQCGS